MWLVKLAVGAVFVLGSYGIAMFIFWIIKGIIKGLSKKEKNTFKF